MKLNRCHLFAATFAACALAATVARAGSGCSDDPERCVERGVTLSHTATVANCATHSHAAIAPATQAVTAAAHKVVAPASASAPHRTASRPAHVTPLPGTATPATPGMGMLLKLSGGAGGDVSWYPSRPADNAGPTWVL